MPGAPVGPENPVPPLVKRRDMHASATFEEDIPDEDRRFVGYGRPANCLPYLMQDRYDRRRGPMTFRAAVLENDVLRAVFLLELGGRLWSLTHKPSGRELLEVNPVFQPANLAIRNAWFSGGVEWNVGLVGHCVFTCSPVFAARATGPGGEPVLRLYEYERLRGAPFQIDFSLPDGSEMLLVRVTLRNPNAVEVPMYWWSNAAVPETPGTRTLAPADHAYRFGMERRMRRVPMDNPDQSYSTRQQRPGDLFFRVPDGHRPWVAALDEDGRGFVQTSTDLLKGRKLFFWGVDEAGQRWQRFLSLPGRAYIELQAGLARTQAEHLPMPPGAVWSWTEAYGLMQADAATVHGDDWERAWRHVESRLDDMLPRAALEALHQDTTDTAERPPDEILQRGSGWGALERLRREATGEPPLAAPALAFDDASLGDDQTPWLTLLREGRLPPRDPADPGPCVVDEAWRRLLDKAVEKPESDHWFAWYHLGVMQAHAGEWDAARASWERSLARERTAWALLSLAAAGSRESRWDEAAGPALEAMRLRPDLAPVVIASGQFLLKADRAAEWLEAVDGAPEDVRRTGRVLLLEAQARLAAGDLDGVEAILAVEGVADDLREGETSLSELWYGMHEQRLSRARGVPVDDALRAEVQQTRPLPASIRFR